MAFTNFYIDSGGNDMNAGSVINAAASVTSTNGSWDITADTFIATGGTPFSGVGVGEWVSIYLDGVSTGAVYVAQVTALFSAGLGVTLSNTAKYGTKPAAGATGRSAKVGGSWLSELPLAAGGLASTTVPSSTKINIKAGTYTIVASRTISMAGTTTAPLWFSGYNTTPGDLDNDTTNALAKPVWSFNATFLITTSGAYQTWSGLNLIGSRSGTIWSAAAATNFRMSRCRSDNTSSNAAAIAFTPGLGSNIIYSWFKTPTTATTTGTMSISASVVVCVGVVSEGGGIAGFNISNAASVFAQCIGLNNTGNGWLMTTAQCQFLNCTTYNSSGDGIKWSGTPNNTTLGSNIIGCLFSNCGGYGINNGSGTNTNNVFRACNDFYACTSGAENGFGDSPAFFGKTDSSAVVTSSTNMTPVVGSNARNNGFPGIFENQTYNSYTDIGAVDHQDAGSAGMLYMPGMSGGMEG